MSGVVLTGVWAGMLFSDTVDTPFGPYGPKGCCGLSAG